MSAKVLLQQWWWMPQPPLRGNAAVVVPNGAQAPTYSLPRGLLIGLRCGYSQKPPDFSVSADESACWKSVAKISHLLGFQVWFGLESLTHLRRFIRVQLGIIARTLRIILSMVDFVCEFIFWADRLWPLWRFLRLGNRHEDAVWFYVLACCSFKCQKLGNCYIQMLLVIYYAGNALLFFCHTRGMAKWFDLPLSRVESESEWDVPGWHGEQETDTELVRWSGSAGSKLRILTTLSRHTGSLGSWCLVQCAEEGATFSTALRFSLLVLFLTAFNHTLDAAYCLLPGGDLINVAIG
jgi:hypothetical protein